MEFDYKGFRIVASDRGRRFGRLRVTAQAAPCATGPIRLPPASVTRAAPATHAAAAAYLAR
jgi:hypothetical protein